MEQGQQSGATPVVSVAGLGPQGEPAIGRLPPVSKRWPWVLCGLLLQLAGVATPVIYVVAKAKRENVGASVTLATVRLAWHQSVHSKAGLAVLIGGAVLFAVGAVALARPYANSWLMLLVAVPIAALAGVLVLGAAALIIALIVVIASGGDSASFNNWGSGSTGGGARRKKRELAAGGNGPGAAA